MRLLLIYVLLPVNVRKYVACLNRDFVSNLIKFKSLRGDLDFVRYMRDNERSECRIVMRVAGMCESEVTRDRREGKEFKILL